MRKTGFCFAMVFVLALACVQADAAAKPVPQKPTAAKVSKQSRKAIELRGQAQKVREKHLKKAGPLLDQIDTAKKELTRISAYRKKTQAYVQSQKVKLAETKRRIAEAAKIKDELDPMLDRTFKELQNQDAARSPWDQATASARMADIERLLDDFDVRPGAKTLAILNELRHRAREACKVQVSEGEHLIEGRIVRVQLMRLGGLGWYALSMDGQKAWVWNQEVGDFEPYFEYAVQIDQAMEIAQRHRVVKLVELPLDMQPAESQSSETQKESQP
jgi:hypothetical protein